MGIDHVEVTRAERQVLGLDDGATGAVDLGRGLRHLVEVREVEDGGAAPAPVEIRDERRPVHRGVDHVVTPDGHGVPRVAGLHVEGRRCFCHLFFDEGTFETNPLILDLQSRLTEDVE